VLIHTLAVRSQGAMLTPVHRAGNEQRPDGSTRESLDDETAIIVPLPPTTSAAMRYWNMARQRLLGAEFTRAYREAWQPRIRA
jgi:hypothetical protein